MNHYEALGVPVDAHPSAVRQAYLAAARTHHPDFHADAEPGVRADHARRMQVVNEAWAVLGNGAARAQYDLTLRVGTARSAERDRTRPEPVVPGGKGWTPRTDDTGWQSDYRSWAMEDERPRPDRPQPRHRGVLAVVPVVLFGAAVLAIFVGLAISLRPLVAGGFAAGIFSAVLFVVMPVLEMSRGRRR